ncbi:MAG: molecular chaperone DnaJ [Anaerolinea sp.]|nr:molecular chaperone DnaJ [Anaerolinea sp.]
MAKNFYDALGVARNATDKEIRSAYRKLARKHHPDVNPNDRAAEARFKEVNAAYEVLSDPEKRRKYDKYGDRWEMADQLEEHQRQSAGSWARSGGPQVNAEQMGDFGSIFDSIFRRERGGPRGQPANRRGQDIETPVDISLDEAFHGTTRTLTLQTSEVCRVCGGTGEVAGAICHNCEGIGQLIKPRRLEVKVPAGVKTGSRVRVAGEGRPGTGAGPSGDLYLVVNVQPHGRFERRGDDLYTDVTVPYLDAILGGEVPVTTMESRVALRIPELTQNGRQIRLAGKGMPVLGGHGRGDLFVRVKVQLPERLTQAERTHLEALRATRAQTVNQ